MSVWYRASRDGAHREVVQVDAEVLRQLEVDPTRQQRTRATGGPDLLPAQLARRRTLVGCARHGDIAPGSRPSPALACDRSPTPEPVVGRARPSRVPGRGVPQRHHLAHPGAPGLDARVTGAPFMLMTRSPATTSSMFLYVASAISTRVPAAEAAGPDADLHPVDTGIDQRLRTGAGRDVAAEHLHVPGRGVGLERGDHVEHQPGLPVGGVGHDHVDAGLDQGGRALPGVAEEADRRGRPAAGSRRPWWRRGYFSVLTKSLTVIRPGQPAGGVDAAAASRSCAWPAARPRRRDEMPTGAVTSGIGVISSRTVRLAKSSAGTNSRSRLVMMPSSAPVLVDHREPGDPVGAAQRVQLGERRVRRRR